MMYSEEECGVTSPSKEDAPLAWGERVSILVELGLLLRLLARVVCLQLGDPPVRLAGHKVVRQKRDRLFAAVNRHRDQVQQRRVRSSPLLEFCLFIFNIYIYIF